MPIIPTRKASINRSNFEAPRVNSELARFKGEQIAKVGKTIEAGVNIFKKYDKAKKDSDKATYQMRSRSFFKTAAAEADALARENAVGTNGDTLVSDFDSNFDAAAKKYLSEVPEDYQQLAEIEMLTAKDAYKLKLIGEQPEFDQKWKAEQVDGFLGESSSDVYNNPSAVKIKIKEFEQFSTGALQLDENSAKRYNDYAKRKLINSAVQSLTDNRKYKEAEKLVRDNVKLFGVGKGLSGKEALGKFKSADEMIDAIRAEKSSNMDKDLKSIRYQEKLEDRREEKQKKGVSEALDRTIENTRQTEDPILINDTLKQLDNLESQRLITPLERKFRAGQLTDYDDVVLDENATVLTITAQISRGEDQDNVQRSIMVAATSGEISYQTAERLINISKTGGRLKNVEKAELNLSNEFIDTAFGNTFSSMAASGKFAAIEKRNKYIGEGYDPLLAAKKAVKELVDAKQIHISPSVREMLPKGAPLTIDNARSVEDINKITRAARNQYKKDQNLKVYKEKLERAKKKLDEIRLSEQLEGVE